MTQAEFYAKNAFLQEVDFTTIDSLNQPPLQNGKVEMSVLSLSVAAVAFASVLTIAANMFLPSCMTAPNVAASAVHRASGPFALVSADVGSVHREKAERARQLFKAVPLNDVERLPDPDHGL